ncbi:MAG: serine hydrolase domain-containing protein [Acidobacteriota bacterium]
MNTRTTDSLRPGGRAEFLARWCRACAACALAASLSWAADSGQLAKIAVRMRELVGQQRIAGTVTLFQEKGELVHFEAVGWQDIENKKPMRKDSIFQIMSMTKPFTGTAILMLAEEGRLSVSDPVEKHLPEFRGQMVTVDGVLRKPRRAVTIHDLMTHTGGVHSAPPAGLAELYTKMNRSLADAVLVYSQQPLDFEPGTRWSYSNAGIATLGRIVEAVSGMAYERFVETRIFQPLGMKDSHFFLPEAKRERLAIVYKKTATGLERADGSILGGVSAAARPGAIYPAPEFGMYSTAEDLARFYQALLSGDRRILSRASIRLMSSRQSGDLRAGQAPYTAFGLTWEVVDEDPRGQVHLLSKGTFGHGGAFSTHGWVDPERKTVGVFLTQLTGAPAEAKQAFLQMANSAVVE